MQSMLSTVQWAGYVKWTTCSIIQDCIFIPFLVGNVPLSLMRKTKKPTRFCNFVL